jgi:hypothetical protein
VINCGGVTPTLPLPTIPFVVVVRALAYRALVVVSVQVWSPPVGYVNITILRRRPNTCFRLGVVPIRVLTTALAVQAQHALWVGADAREESILCGRFL